MTLPNKIVLSGFMGVGKTLVGQALAERLGYLFVDTDLVIEEQEGKPIGKIFDCEGEKKFRLLEAKAIDVALKKDKVVIAVGGGAVCHHSNLSKIQRRSVLILLKASASVILNRLDKDAQRPLLQGVDKKQQINHLLEKRERFYKQIQWQIDTDGKKIVSIVKEILDILPIEGSALTVKLGERSYPLYFNGIQFLGSLLKKHFVSKKVVLVTNRTVHRIYGKKIRALLQKDFDLYTSILPDGEKYKTLHTVESLYRDFVRFKVDRQTPIVALGGGVVGDIVGFVSGSFLRGVPFVQVPTTLLAQVDSSIGGKTGVDLPEGKNLVGAFCQPKFVLIDEQFLSSLSPRDFRSGLAEVVKYAAIFDAKLFKLLEDNFANLLRHQGEGLERIIRRCCELKACVVEKDEFETCGIRSKLNFGHTLGHAIENLTSYQKYSHGEAVAMGMIYAAKLSKARLGLHERGCRRLQNLIKNFNLPIDLPKFSKTKYLRALMQDKKRVVREVNFVYLTKIGQASVVPTTLDEILSVI